MLSDGPGARPQPTPGRLLLCKGSASPFLWLDALLRAARREGVDVRYGTRVEAVEKEAGKVLLCTDWAVPDLLAPLGIEMPVVPLPKEILVTRRPDRRSSRSSYHSSTGSR